jgi:tetratricopeptide (TPR) repeat protein
MRSPNEKFNTVSACASTQVSTRLPLPVWLMATVLVLVTVALYWPALQCGFVDYDDNVYVTENPHVENGLTWAGVKWAFYNTQQAAYWAPMMWLSHELACQFFGLNPWGHHLINVLLHAANVVLVFFLLRQLTGATWRSFLVAALFGWHPLRVESVAWVTERKDVLSAFFGLLSLLFYVRYAQNKKTLNSQPSTLNYVLTLLFYALGLMSKAMLVTWPFVMLLLDWWPLKRFTIHDSRFTIWPLLREKIPFFGLAAAASVVTYLVQKNGGAVMSMATLPFGVRLENALISYCRYLGKLFWPVNLAIFYPHPVYWPMEQVLLAGGLLLGITVWCVVVRRQYPFMLMGWLWFVGTLVPVIQLVQSGNQMMADRFSYIPSLGVTILIIWGVCELIRQWRYQTMVLSLAGCATVSFCLVLTWQQINYWKDDETIFRHALAATKNSYVAHYGLGFILNKRGHTDEAIAQYLETIRLEPNYANGHYSLGNTLNTKGQTDAAISQFQEAIRLKPDWAEAHYSLGNALNTKDRTDAAISQFQEAIRLKPDWAEAHNNLGNILLKKGRLDEAISQYQEAVRLKPDYAEVCYNLGTALVTKGRIDEAISQFREAVRLKPDWAEAHRSFGTALGMKAQTNEAINQFQTALRLKSDDAEAHFGLGTALSAKGQNDDAIFQFQEAIRLKPDYAEAHNNLGTALAMKGRLDEAIGQYQEVVRLYPDYAEAHCGLGVILGMKGQTDDAIHQFQEALRLKPDYAEARHNLTHALELKNASTNR